METECGCPVDDVSIGGVICSVDDIVYLHGYCSCSNKVIIKTYIDRVEVEGVGTTDV